MLYLLLKFPVTKTLRLKGKKVNLKKLKPENIQPRGEEGWSSDQRAASWQQGYGVESSCGCCVFSCMSSLPSVQVSGWCNMSRLFFSLLLIHCWDGLQQPSSPVRNEERWKVETKQLRDNITLNCLIGAQYAVNSVFLSD